MQEFEQCNVTLLTLKLYRYLLDKRAVRYGKNSQNEEIEMKLLAEDQGARLQVKENPKVFSQIMLEQFVRGMIHMVQFAISYCIMLMFMYSNGTYCKPSNLGPF